MVQHSDANRGINSATFGAESFFNLLVLEKGQGVRLQMTSRLSSIWRSTDAIFRRSCLASRFSATPALAAKRRTKRTHQPSSMKSAQRSAIITVGAFVFPLTSSGMIEMSAMRRRGTPWTRSFGSTTAIESTPILQVQDG